MITAMKKILLILLLIMPSIFVLADGPQYKFLRSMDRNASVGSRQSARQGEHWAKPTDINLDINVNARTVNYDEVFRVAVSSRPLVSSDVTISETGTGNSNGSSPLAGALGRKGNGSEVSAKSGSMVVSGFGGSAHTLVELGHGKLALVGSAIDPDQGTWQPPKTAHTPLGDAMVPMLLMALAFAAIKFKKN